MNSDAPSLRAWQIALLIALPIGLLFGSALVTEGSFATRDAGHFYYPLFHWSSQEWKAGRVPLWNPQEGGGSPVVADASSSVFYPGKLLFALPISYSFKFKLYVVAHVVLCAVGAYRLSRNLSCSPQAAVLAAIAYSCGGSVAFQYCNVVFLVGAAWLPWAWEVLLRLLRTTSLRSALALAMVLALMILGGDPQMVVHVAIVGMLFVIVQWWTKTPAENLTRESGTGGSKWRLALGQGMCLGLALAAAFGLAAVQILPSREAAKGSTRAAYVGPRNVYEVAAAAKERSASEIFRSSGAHSHQVAVYDFSIGPWRFAELFWPNVYGRMFPTHRRWLNELPGEGRIWTPTLYLGLLTSVLGLWQLRFRSADSTQRWLTWTFVLFALGSLGWYGIGWGARELYASLTGGDSDRVGIAHPVGGVYWFLVTLIPGYVQFRYPAKLFVVASLALALLAGRGWDAALRQPKAGWRTGLIGVASLSAAGWLTSLLAGSWFIRRAWKADVAFGPFDALGALADLRLAFLQAFLVASLATILLELARRRKQSLWSHALLVLLVLDIGLANRWFVATAPSETWNTPGELAAQVQADGASVLYRARVGGWWPGDFQRALSPDRMAEICAWEHQTLFPKHHLLENVTLADSSSSLRPLDRESYWRIGRELRGPASLTPHENVLRLMGVQHVATPAGFRPNPTENWHEAELPGPLAQNARLWRISDPLPKAWIVYQVETLPSLKTPNDPREVDERTRQVLSKEGAPRDFQRSAVVETDHPLPRFATLVDDPLPADCQVTALSPQRLVVEAELSRPGFLVISQPYFDGWVARRMTDEGPVVLPIFRTNRIQQGVVLPAGKHHVELSYEPASFYAGAVISTLFWLTLGIVTAVAYAKRRRSLERKQPG